MVPGKRVVRTGPRCLGVFGAVRSLCGGYVSSNLALYRAVTHLGGIDSSTSIEYCFATECCSSGGSFGATVGRVSRTVELVVSGGAVTSSRLGPLRGTVYNLTKRLCTRISGPQGSLRCCRLCRVCNLGMPSSSRRSLLSFESCRRCILSSLVGGRVAMSEPQIVGSPFSALLVG